MDPTDLTLASSTVGRYPTVNEFVEESHQRDDHGRFTSGGSTASDPKTPPPPGKDVHNPDVFADGNKDGVTDSARIGVPGMSVPPPPNIGKLPNLTPHEREVENSFIRHFEANPDKVAAEFRDMVHAARKPGEPPTFGTDDAKQLHDAWSHPDMTLADRSENRATLNCALHQTANAIAKRAFVQELDSMKAGDSVMVTVGGCGAGKGYSLGKVPEVMAMKNSAKAVWDSAGDQNATENPWIKQECDKRGIKSVFAFVHANPEKQWADPAMGVVKRAGDPKDGRMVDADVFADSYAIGAKNHQAFYDKHKDDPNSTFVFLSNGQKIPKIPDEALHLDRDSLASFARSAVRTSGAPPHVVRGATVGSRIWGASDWGE